MKRHYCVHCGSKKYESKMKQFWLPFLLAKAVWVCDVCCSRLNHTAVEVEK